MRGLDREKTLPREVYFSESYFTYAQLWSLSEQIFHIRQLKPMSMIEVGIGNGFVSGFFRTMDVQVKTFDINASLEPDVVASVHDLGSYVTPGEFDLISCCEVLEHLPFDEFESTIQSFSKLSPKLFLTLPAYGRKIGFGGVIQLPRFQRWLGLWLQLPKKQGLLPDMHFWEVDYDNRSSQQEIMRILGNYYQTIETGLFKANPYHRYFKCTRTVG